MYKEDFKKHIEERNMKISSDEEYYFCCGKMLNYMLCRTYRGVGIQRNFMPFTKILNREKFRESFIAAFEKANSKIYYEDIYFRRVFAAIMEYSPGKKVLDAPLIAGYMDTKITKEADNGENR